MHASPARLETGAPRRPLQRLERSFVSGSGRAQVRNWALEGARADSSRVHARRRVCAGETLKKGWRARASSDERYERALARPIELAPRSTRVVQGSPQTRSKARRIALTHPLSCHPLALSGANERGAPKRRFQEPLKPADR